jgi:hypothetical protein
MLKYVQLLLVLSVFAVWMMMRSANLSAFDIPEAAYDVSHYLLEGLKTSNGLDNHYTSNITGYPDRAFDEATRAHTGSQRIAKAVIAYAVSITACNNPKDLTDGAAVLKHSIHLSSIRNPNSTSKYDYRLIAFIHPNATRCESTLEKLGYEVSIRDTPVDVTQIKNNSDMIRRVTKSGCCGEKEFLKLYSFTLFDYPVVVHLDLDTAILRPLDDLFDVMLLPANATKHIPAAMWTPNVTHPVNAIFTRDYPMINPGRKVKKVGMQGGFFVVRPDQQVFDEYCSIIMSGQFYPGPGWGGANLNYGGYFGAAQIQGLVSYFYGHYHPDTYIELNRCNYNQMVDNPRDKKKGVCMTGEENCQDCRDTNVPDIYSVHYTLCQKPWWCPSPEHKWLNESVWEGSGSQAALCMKLHHEWHRIRNDLEQTWQITATSKTAFTNHSPKVTRDSFGHCQPGGGRFGYKYIPLLLPTELQPL